MNKIDVFLKYDKKKSLQGYVAIFTEMHAYEC